MKMSSDDLIKLVYDGYLNNMNLQESENIKHCRCKMAKAVQECVNEESRANYVVELADEYAFSSEEQGFIRGYKFAVRSILACIE